MHWMMMMIDDVNCGYWVHSSVSASPFSVCHSKRANVIGKLFATRLPVRPSHVSHALWGRSTNEPKC